MKRSLMFMSRYDSHYILLLLLVVAVKVEPQNSEFSNNRQ